MACTFSPEPMVAARPPTAMALVEAKKAVPWPRLPSRMASSMRLSRLAMLSIQRTRCACTAPTRLRVRGRPGRDQPIDADRQQEVGESDEIERRGKRVEAHGRFPLSPLARSAVSRQLQAVERALQDQRGGHLVDHLRRGAGARHRPPAASARRPAVDSRSSHSRIGSGGEPARLRAKARVAWARGPCEPSRLSGSPITKPPTPCSAASASRRAASAANLLRAQCGEPRGDGARDVGERQAQRLGADVDADQAGAARQGARRRPRVQHRIPRLACRRAASLSAGSRADHGVLLSPSPALYSAAATGQRLEERARMKIVWFGHSCFRLETGNSVDPHRPVPQGQSDLRDVRRSPGTRRPRA